MARKRSKQQKSASAQPRQTSGAGTARPDSSDAPLAMQAGPPSAGAPRKSGVGLGTCCAAAALTLLLGVLLGLYADDRLLDFFAAQLPAATESAGQGAAVEPSGVGGSAKSGGAVAALVAAEASGAGLPLPGDSTADKGTATKSAVVLPPMPEELARSIAAMEKAARERPADVAVWTKLGNLYFDTSQAEKAAAAYTQALRYKPALPDVLTDRGIMLRELGRFTEAVADFRKASALDPRHENSLFNEGCVLYYDLKQPAEAERVWKRLLAVNPCSRAPDGRSVAELLKHLY